MSNLTALANQRHPTSGHRVRTVFSRAFYAVEMKARAATVTVNSHEQDFWDRTGLPDDLGLGARLSEL